MFGHRNVLGGRGGVVFLTPAVVGGIQMRVCVYMCAFVFFIFRTGVEVIVQTNIYIHTIFIKHIHNHCCSTNVEKDCTSN